MLNLSNIDSFSTISHNFDLRPSFMMIWETGFLGLQMSHSLTVRQSLVARYFPPFAKETL